MAICFAESKDRSGCGDLKGVSTLTPLHECRDDVSALLKRFLLSNKNLVECELILFRAGHFGLCEDKVK